MKGKTGRPTTDETDARLKPERGKKDEEGLYIEKRIVEAHGGRIWMDSVLGRSSTFRCQARRELAGLP